MLGTVSNLSALEVISNIATIIAASATTVAAYYAFQSFQSWEERVKKQHFLENKAAAIKELSLCYEMCMSDLTIYLSMVEGFEVHLRVINGIHNEITRAKQSDKTTKQEKVFENQHKYKSTFFFAQSFYKTPIIPAYSPDIMEKHFNTLSKLAKTNSNWSELQIDYVVRGTNEILGLYENQK
tara:strand:- start:1813 stop:2358 length:546 start_codon:yes stop_codon:yes gene_type:complete